MTDFTTRPEIRGNFGVVTSTHWLASAVGMSILERGGNAFDAAVAAGFTLQVVEPHLNGPGGDVPLLFYSAQEDRPRVLCGQGPAPLQATIDHYRSLGLSLVPGTGFLAAVVPGAFGAWLTLLRDYGSLGVEDVLAPAVHYAGQGYPLLPRIVEAVASVRELFTDAWPTSAAVYLDNGQLPAVDKPFRNPALAASYQRIIDEAKTASGRGAQIDRALDAFYRGFVAEALIGFNRNELPDSSGRRHAGLLEMDDLAGWQPRYEEPVYADYHNLRVFKCGPWSQGPVFLQQLALLRGFDIAAMNPNGAEFVHTVIECAKLAFADREMYYGDPDFVKVPLDYLLCSDYHAERRTLIEPRASLQLRPGFIPGADGRLPDYAALTAGSEIEHGAGEPTMARYQDRGDTCHLDVIDRWGNMVAATPSGGWLQSSPVVPGLGFNLGTRAQMFWLQEGLPNSLAPGKRPRTTLTPSLCYRDGEPYMVWGTPGGDQQDQWTVTFLLRHLHHGLNLQAAIDAPLFHSTHFPSSFYPRQANPGGLEIEGRFGAEVIAELEARGHGVNQVDDWDIGRLTAACRDRHFIRAAATPRGMQAYAVGR